MADEISMRSLRRRTVLAMVASAIGACAANARIAPDLVDLSVVDRETGETLQVWRRGGRLFVAGRPGARYSLRLANRSAGRILAVMSVDGVNILTGETAGYGQNGYVFDPYETNDVSGWRKSGDEVAAFTFAPLPQSYAARTGRPLDVGVIGVAVFTERTIVPKAAAPSAEPRAERRGAPALAPPTARDQLSETVVTAQKREERLGTAHGQREWSVVDTVAFQRATAYPQLIRRIEYDTYDNLVAAGVIPPAPRWPRRPRPFPSDGGGGYVPDPPGGL